MSNHGGIDQKTPIKASNLASLEIIIEKKDTILQERQLFCFLRPYCL
tara:strand:- start:132 stop:272 length:141 start_codon:yes stop_codon:yes gene_type:complete